MTAPSRERRRAPRALAEFPIQLNPERGAAPALLKDLSAIGLCCTTGAEMKEMTQVGIDLQLPGQSRRHRIEGAVVRCDPVAGKGGEYEVAVFFTAIDPATKTALGAWVDQAPPA